MRLDSLELGLLEQEACQVAKHRQYRRLTTEEQINIALKRSKTETSLSGEHILNS